MRRSLSKIVISQALAILIASTGHALDLPTTTAHIKRIQMEIVKIRARQKREADLIRWYRQKEAVLANKRQKPWQIIPSKEERQQAQAAEAIASLMDKEERSIKTYELSIRRYAWAYVVVHDYQANVNYRIAKNLVPYIEEGTQLMQEISGVKESINQAQLTETTSAVSNIFNARSAAVFSKMGSNATLEARKKTQETLTKAALFLAKIEAGGKSGFSNEPISKNGPAYNPASRAINSIVALDNLSEAYAKLNEVNEKIDIIVSSLVEDVHILEGENERIAVDLANRILSQKNF